jgi:DNA-binding transcriptional ArsR family regulator
MIRMSTKPARRPSRSRGEKRRNAPAGEIDRFAQVFAALGEPTRLRIMQILPRQAICEEMYNVIELADELGLTQPTVSHHLKILSEAGVLACRRACNSMYYYVDQSAILDWLKEVKARFGCDSAAR